MDWDLIEIGLASCRHCIDTGLTMDLHKIGNGFVTDLKRIGRGLKMVWCPIRPPSRHFGKSPYSTLVRRSHVQTSSDRQRIGVICANVCQSCVDPVLMIGSDRCEERLFG